jgi:hypothetical protein
LKDAQEAKKAAELKKKQELLELFKPVQAPQKVPFGTDPKTVLCEFFKAGHCEKGNKCKFSHDLSVTRKDQKKDLYTDSRKEKEEGMLIELLNDQIRLADTRLKFLMCLF